MPKILVNPERAVAMHRDEGLSSLQIARAMGVQPPAIFRAFRKMGYITPGMVEARKRRKQQKWEDKLLPPDIVHNTRGTRRGPEMPPMPEPTPRFTCARCGVRSDIGCRHHTERLGWHVG